MQTGVAIDNKNDLEKVIDISTDQHSSVIVLGNGDVMVAGYNNNGNLGIAQNYSIKKFTKVPGIPPAKKASVNSHHTIILLQNGEIMVSGFNDYGQMGIEKQESYTFTKVPNIQHVMDVSAGARSSIILLETGKIMVTGYNYHGQLGLGHANNINIFTKVPNLSGVKEISYISDYSIVLLNNGTIMVVGGFPIGSSTKSPTYTVIPNIPPVKHISCSENHSLIVLETGEIMGVGINQMGELGISTETMIKQFTYIPNISNVNNVYCGITHSILLLNTGEIMVTGNNHHGELGIDKHVEINFFEKVPNVTNIVKVSSFEGHTIILMSDGNIMGAGNNTYGQLGSDTENIYVFKPIVYDIPAQQPAPDTNPNPIEEPVSVPLQPSAPQPLAPQPLAPLTPQPLPPLQSSIQQFVQQPVSQYIDTGMVTKYDSNLKKMKQIVHIFNNYIENILGGIPHIINNVNTIDTLNDYFCTITIRINKITPDIKKNIIMLYANFNITMVYLSEVPEYIVHKNNNIICITDYKFSEIEYKNRKQVECLYNIYTMLLNNIIPSNEHIINLIKNCKVKNTIPEQQNKEYVGLYTSVIYLLKQLKVHFREMNDDDIYNRYILINNAGDTRFASNLEGNLRKYISFEMGGLDIQYDNGGIIMIGDVAVHTIILMYTNKCDLKTIFVALLDNLNRTPNNEYSAYINCILNYVEKYINADDNYCDYDKLTPNDNFTFGYATGFDKEYANDVKLLSDSPKKLLMPNFTEIIKQKTPEPLKIINILPEDLKLEALEKITEDIFNKYITKGNESFHASKTLYDHSRWTKNFIHMLFIGVDKYTYAFTKYGDMTHIINIKKIIDTNISFFDKKVYLNIAMGGALLHDIGKTGGTKNKNIMGTQGVINEHPLLGFLYFTNIMPYFSDKFTDIRDILKNTGYDNKLIYSIITLSSMLHYEMGALLMKSKYMNHTFQNLDEVSEYIMVYYYVYFSSLKYVDTGYKYTTSSTKTLIKDIFGICMLIQIADIFGSQPMELTEQDNKKYSTVSPIPAVKYGYTSENFFLLVQSIFNNFDWAYNTFFLNNSAYYSTHFNNLPLCLLPLPYAVLDYYPEMTYFDDSMWTKGIFTKIYREMNNDKLYTWNINNNTLVPEFTEIMKSGNNYAVTNYNYDIQTFMPLSTLNINYLPTDDSRIFILFSKTSGRFYICQNVTQSADKKTLKFKNNNILFVLLDIKKNKWTQGHTKYMSTFKNTDELEMEIDIADISVVIALAKITDKHLKNDFMPVTINKNIYENLYHGTISNWSDSTYNKMVKDPAFFSLYKSCAYPDSNSSSNNCIIFKIDKNIDSLLDLTMPITHMNPIRGGGLYDGIMKRIDEINNINQLFKIIYIWNNVTGTSYSTKVKNELISLINKVFNINLKPDDENILTSIQDHMGIIKNRYEFAKYTHQLNKNIPIYQQIAISLTSGNEPRKNKLHEYMSFIDIDTTNKFSGRRKLQEIFTKTRNIKIAGSYTDNIEETDPSYINSGTRRDMDLSFLSIFPNINGFVSTDYDGRLCGEVALTQPYKYIHMGYLSSTMCRDTAISIDNTHLPIQYVEFEQFDSNIIKYIYENAEKIYKKENTKGFDYIYSPENIIQTNKNVLNLSMEPYFAKIYNSITLMPNFTQIHETMGKWTGNFYTDMNEAARYNIDPFNTYKTIYDLNIMHKSKTGRIDIYLQLFYDMFKATDNQEHNECFMFRIQTDFIKVLPNNYSRIKVSNDKLNKGDIVEYMSFTSFSTDIKSSFQPAGSDAVLMVHLPKNYPCVPVRQNGYFIYSIKNLSVPGIVKKKATFDKNNIEYVGEYTVKNVVIKTEEVDKIDNEECAIIINDKMYIYGRVHWIDNNLVIEQQNKTEIQKVLIDAQYVSNMHTLELYYLPGSEISQHITTKSPLRDISLTEYEILMKPPFFIYIDKIVKNGKKKYILGTLQYPEFYHPYNIITSKYKYNLNIGNVVDCIFFIFQAMTNANVLYVKKVTRNISNIPIYIFIENSTAGLSNKNVYSFVYTNTLQIVQFAETLKGQIPSINIKFIGDISIQGLNIIKPDPYNFLMDYFYGSNIIFPKFIVLDYDSTVGIETFHGKDMGEYIQSHPEDGIHDGNMINHEIYDLVNFCSSQKIKIILCTLSKYTESSGSLIHNFLKKNKLEYIDGTIYPNDIIGKTKTRIFEYLKQTYNIVPTETIFFDDLEQNIGEMIYVHNISHSFQVDGTKGITYTDIINGILTYSKNKMNIDRISYVSNMLAIENAIQKNLTHYDNLLNYTLV